jgi:hypothetical protein
MIMLFAYDGWSDVTLVAGEVKNPGRNIGRAVLLGTLILTVLYGLTQVAVMTALPGGRAADSAQPVTAAVEATLGSAAGRGVSALVVVATFGSISGTVLTVSRLGFAMAGSGAFFRGLATLHPRWGTPARATSALAAASVAYVFLASFRNILALFTFSVWIFYGITAVGLLILRRRGVGEPVAWRAPLGWVPPAVLAVGRGDDGSARRGRSAPARRRGSSRPRFRLMRSSRDLARDDDEFGGVLQRDHAAQGAVLDATRSGSRRVALKVLEHGLEVGAGRPWTVSAASPRARWCIAPRSGQALEQASARETPAMRFQASITGNRAGGSRARSAAPQVSCGASVSNLVIIAHGRHGRRSPRGGSGTRPLARPRGRRRLR